MISKITLAAVLVVCQIGGAYAQGTSSSGGGANDASSSADVKNSDMLKGKATSSHKKKHSRTAGMKSMKTGGGDNGASSSADVKNSDKMMKGKTQ